MAFCKVTKNTRFQCEKTSGNNLKTNLIKPLRLIDWKICALKNWKSEKLSPFEKLEINHNFGDLMVTLFFNKRKEQSYEAIIGQNAENQF